MKFNCDFLEDRIREELIRQRQWNDWFAWYPVKVAPKDCRWLEKVERRRFYFDAWDYRAKDAD